MELPIIFLIVSIIAIAIIFGKKIKKNIHNYKNSDIDKF